MPRACTDQEFIETFQRLKSPAAVAKFLGTTRSAVFGRRRRIEERTGISLKTDGVVEASRGKAAMGRALQEARTAYEHRMTVTASGTVIVFSDAHYWPGIVTTAHRALVELCRDLDPVLVVANGDILDGATISRHDRIGWEQQPKLKDELAAVQDRLGEIQRAAKKAQLIRTIGNHDIRYERFLSNHAAQYEDILGVTLLDHLPAWRAGWSLFVNDTCVIKHRYANGVHAAYNNTVKSGRSIVTGHLHRLIVTPWGDYNGRRWGVDTGTLADPTGPQFHYTEDDPKPWCSGFAVLTFDRDGQLLPPELCEVIRGKAYFRGQVVV